ncbi:hypothetical protein I7I50_11077 [Histoplasma capsulatum G186AR]|uniref:Uncharacterized protein n=1 Tax=Ajellomyces capsulatus TaxID=5037 RepID=A0A8H8D905_AJECA|nr:hypothetical protein I7I52_02316 [Histoplasma capsulatum]QSS69696.1 hypothetical protein I7I50_11077 [Histoplasma capsulatum G186AR]
MWDHGSFSQLEVKLMLGIIWREVKNRGGCGRGRDEREERETEREKFKLSSLGHCSQRYLFESLVAAADCGVSWME